MGRCGLLADPKVGPHCVPGGGQRVRQVVQPALRLQPLHCVPSHVRPSSQSEVLDFVVQVVAVHIEDDADVEDEEGHQQVGDVCG